MLKLQTTLFTLILCLAVFNAEAQEREFNLDETYAIEKGGTLYLDSDDAEVMIKGTDRDDVHVVVYRRVDVDGWKVKADGSFDMEVENRGGDLYIREIDNDRFSVLIGSIDVDYRISIEVPREVALDLEGDDDSYEISDINGAFTLSADDTEVKLNGMNGDRFEFDFDDGNIEMDRAQGRLELNMDDGEFFVRKGEFSEIRADYDDGNVDIATSLSDAGSYDVSMDDGSFELDITSGGGRFDIHHDNGEISVGSTFEELSSTEGRIVYKLKGGDARVDIDADDGEVELRNR